MACEHCQCYHEYDWKCCDCGRDPFETETSYTEYIEDEDYYWDDEDEDDE